MMAQNFPKDVFDSVTDVGGRHRAKRTVGSRFISFTRYAGVAALLSAVAVVALTLSSDNSIFSGTVGNKTATQSQSFNSGGLGVTVIDATEQKGLATKVAQRLYDAGWNVLTATNLNAPGTTVVQPGLNLDGVPAANEPETTIVYAINANAQSAAQSVLKTLGNYKVLVSATYADPVTIVLGRDFK